MPKADVIFFNGQVLTMDSDMTMAEALAVKDGVIVAVGNSSTVLEMADSDTVIVDLNGKTLMPGFVDSHTHIFNDRARVGLREHMPNGTLEEAQQLALKLGITTLADMWVDRGFLEEFKEFEPNLKVRTKLYLVYITNCGDLLGQWWAGELPLTSASGRLQVTPGVKIFADGGSCKAPAFTIELEPNFYGDLFLTVDQLVDAVTDMDSQGLQVAIHAIGDRAVETALDALETVLAGQPNTLRHRIDHNLYIRPDQLPRYGQIGVVPSVWNSGACWIHDAVDAEGNLGIYGGPTTHSWASPWRSLIDQNPGIKLAWQSDTPWLGLGPITDLYNFVTRNEVKVYPYYGIDLGPIGTVCNAQDWLLDEAVTVEEALQMMTINSAYALHMDDVLGSLEPGKYADIVVLSDNPLTVTDNELKDLEVLVTMIGGIAEFCAPGAPGSDSICP
ncbi:MAG: amidohydrolase family protein [Chloroflexi bacterium]|nr:amidohydrolase family protein [Chloroflexota bacterium]